jgi:hypothetical protein
MTKRIQGLGRKASGAVEPAIEHAIKNVPPNSDIGELLSRKRGYLSVDAPNKYRNKPVVIGTRRFSSKAEARRAQELELLQAGGVVQDLQYQVAFDLHACADANRGSSPPAWYPVKVGRYIADFTYHFGGAFIVEDVKGVRTAGYMRSKRHMKAEYGIEIFETS